MFTPRLTFLITFLLAVLAFTLYFDLRGRYAYSQIEYDGHGFNLSLNTVLGEFILTITRGKYDPNFADPSSSASEFYLGRSDYPDVTPFYTLGPFALSQLSYPPDSKITFVRVFDTFDCIGLHCSAWVPESLLAALFLWFLWRAYRRRPRPALCTNCRYDLRASKNRCPECGTPINPMPAKTLPLWPRLKRLLFQSTAFTSFALFFLLLFATCQGHQIPRAFRISYNSGLTFIIWGERAYLVYFPGWHGQEAGLPLSHSLFHDHGIYPDKPPSYWNEMDLGPFISARHIGIGADFIDLDIPPTLEDRLAIFGENIRHPIISIPLWLLLPLFTIAPTLYLTRRIRRKKS